MKKQALKYLTITTLGLAALASANGAVHAETMDQQVDTEPALQVSIPLENVNISLDPSTHPFGTGDIPVTVATNNPTGYHISISADGTSMIEIHDETKTIPTLSENEGGYTQETFEANRWGYRIAPGNYRPFVSGTPIGGGDGPTNGDITDVTFASKVDFLQPSGSYQIAVNFAVVANPTLMLIQDLDPTYCTETPLYVMDARDGEEYMIQRLADGKCWMLDNLRLDPTQVPTSVLQGKTNAPDKAIEYLKNGGGNGQKYAVEGVKLETESNWWSNTYESPSVRTVEEDNVLDTPGIGSGKVGVIYNYCAVSAGTYCHNTPGYFGNDVYDVCPSGWRLPTGTSSGDYGNLYDIVKVYDVYDSGSYLNYQKSGLAFRTALNLPEDTIYWTSTFSSYYSEMYVLDTGHQDPSLEEDKDNQGMRPIRCLMEERTINDITYMQDVTPRIIKNTPDDTTATLKDYRDEQEYSVVKDTVTFFDTTAYRNVENAIVMMTRNIAIGCNGTGNTYGSGTKDTTLIPATSNLQSPWTMPTADFSGEFSPEMRCDSTYGAYYNYYTAAAETAIEGEVEGFQHSLSPTEYDICPAGWTIPGHETSAYQSESRDYWPTKYADTFAAQDGGNLSSYDGNISLGYYSGWWLNWSLYPNMMNFLWYRSNEIKPTSPQDWWGHPNNTLGIYLRCVSYTENN